MADNALVDGADPRRVVDASLAHHFRQLPRSLDVVEVRIYQCLQLGNRTGAIVLLERHLRHLRVRAVAAVRNRHQSRRLLEGSHRRVVVAGLRSARPSAIWTR